MNTSGVVCDTLRLLKHLVREPDDYRRRLATLGLLSSLFSKNGISSYAVGGSAIEIYTAGQFRTGDIDLVVSDREKAAKILEGVGFRKSGRVWEHPELDVVVDLLVGKRKPVGRKRTFRFGRRTILVAPVEDLIINRLVSAKYWKSTAQTDIEQAKTLLEVFTRKVDLALLKREAERQRVKDYLKTLVP